MKPTIGCYVDGANQPQIEGDARTVRLSESFGRVLDRETAKFCQRVLDYDVATERDYEMSDDFSREAEEWLDDNASLAYTYWGWDHGNFGLWPSVENAEDGCDFVSVESLVAARSLETDPEDSSYPPKDYEGHWLHISDHGNCTLYLRQDGKDTEVWGVV